MRYIFFIFFIFISFQANLASQDEEINDQDSVNNSDNVDNASDLSITEPPEGMDEKEKEVVQKGIERIDNSDITTPYDKTLQDDEKKEIEELQKPQNKQVIKGKPRSRLKAPVIPPTTIPQTQSSFNYKTNDELLLRDYQEDYGSFVGQYYTSSDEYRLDLGFRFNPRLSLSTVSEFSDLLGLEVHYAVRKLHYWWEFHFAYTNAKVGKITSNSGSLADETESIMEGGIGLSQRFRLFQNFFHNDRIFETASASLTYATTSVSGVSYKGPGYRADFGVHYRYKAQGHYGLKFGHHVLAGKNTEMNFEKTISYFTLGLDFAIYF